MDKVIRKKNRKKLHKHSWSKWEFQYEIHNGNDVWERKCLKCGFTDFTVSKLIPLKK